MSLNCFVLIFQNLLINFKHLLNYWTLVIFSFNEGAAASAEPLC